MIEPKKITLLIKLDGRQADIFEFLNELPKTKYPPEALKLSSMNKNDSNENYHLYITVTLDKAPPKQKEV